MRRVGHTLITNALGVSLLVACAPESVPDFTADGLPIVRPVVDASPLPREEVLRIGDVEGENALFRVAGLALGPNGELYVLETASVSVFDSMGIQLRRFGQRGEGPTDFKAAQTLQVVRDTVVVGDMDNRLHFFRTDGTHIRTRVYRDLITEGWRTYFTIGTPDGWLLRASRSDLAGWEPGQPAPAEPLSQQFELHWLDSEGNLSPAGFRWGDSRTGQWQTSGGGLMFLEPPYSHGAHWAVDGLGRVHVASTAHYAFDVSAPDGSALRRVEIDVPRIVIDDAMLEAWLERVCRRGAPCPLEQALSLPGPEHLPVVEDLWAFTVGHIAVRRADLKPEPADPRAVGPWDVFDPDGNFLGTLPGEVRPLWFDGETLLTRERGELDVEQVVKYRVR